MAAMSGACQPTSLSCQQGKILNIVHASCKTLGLLWCDCWAFFCSTPKDVSGNVQTLCQNRSTCEVQASKLCDGGRYLNVKYNCESQAKSIATPAETIASEATSLITEHNGYAPPPGRMPSWPASASVEQDGYHHEAEAGETAFPDLSEDDSSPLDPKLIAAIAIAGGVVLLLILLVILICLRRRQSKGSTTATRAVVDEKPKGLFEMVGQVAVSDYNQRENETNKPVASDDDRIDEKPDELSEGNLQSVVSDGKQTNDKPNELSDGDVQSVVSDCEQTKDKPSNELSDGDVQSVISDDEQTEEKPIDQTADQATEDKAPTDRKPGVGENEVAHVAAEDTPAATYAAVKKPTKNI